MARTARPRSAAERPAASRPAAPPAADRVAPALAPRARKAFRWLRLAVLVCVWGSLAAAATLLVLIWDLPRTDIALSQTRRAGVTLEAANGTIIATAGDVHGQIVRLRDLPAHLPAALLAIEDRRFRDHFGLDPIGIARAAWVNYSTGQITQGGSTLTQQLAKNLFLTPERSFRRKAQEAVMALWLEWRFSKDELLEIYLNRVYLGAGAFGVDAAARVYFGIPATRLNLWQSAILAGLPKAPSRLNPRTAPDAAAGRAAEVLGAMAETGFLTRQEATLAAERIQIPPRPSRDSGWFADWAIDDLASRFPGNADLVLRTSLDLRVQAVVEARLEALLAGPGARAGVGQGAVVVMEAETGLVRAMAGGRDYRRSQFNRVTQARRQPGSAFKPFVFLAAMEAGAFPQDRVADGPISLGGWRPGNGGWRSQGEITLEEALAHSVNTAAVRVLARGGGARAVTDLAQRFGLPGPFPRDATLALGTGEVTLLDLVAAYAPFANGGLLPEPRGLVAARADGRAVPVGRPTLLRVTTAERAGAMRRMLEAVVARGTGRAAQPPGAAPVAGKTGTTQDFRDAWFIGLAPAAEGARVIGIWLGNDDATPMQDVRGGTLPARLFRDILETLARPAAATAAR
ncbi:transglycosylase domain-containing protein [Falsiroseomonas selenitidurans]|uniref:peptidoglycan glycosyltransferase n=1 Tax=Falsiroseomonas selenitidurans TaxID=2716335 RepID=A0ABX1E720_9PROT|nr:transglycosylase domain-containing protein [Falsiroseomonas selenitidurans]NKC32736.1 transpeptidase-transglycosylase [Falsiroseomonas selenitidurans]